MTNKKLISLTLVAAVLVGLAYLSSSTRRMKTPSQVGKTILPGLSLGDIARIEVGAQGGSKLVLESGDAGWAVKSLFGYPADISKIRENLLKLADLKIGHVATGKKLDNPVLVDLQNAAGKSLATLSLGDKHTRQATGEMAAFGGGGSYPDGRYVSAAGADTVFLVKETLEAFDGDPKNWTDTQIASVPSAEITAITLTPVQGPTVSLNKKDGAWQMDGLGDKEEFDTSKSYGVESALSYLNFNTVADPKQSDEALGLSTAAVYTVSLKNGESYTAKIGGTMTNSTDRFVRISAAYSPIGTNATEHAEIKKKVDAFNAKSAEWTFAVSSYTAENMTQSRSDLVKAKEEPKKEGEKQ